MTLEAYLDELCAALQVESLRKDEIRLETHLHLRDRAKALVQQGYSQENAEERAVQEFGPPLTIAAQLSQKHPPTPKWSNSRHLQYVGILLIGFGLERISHNIGFEPGRAIYLSERGLLLHGNVSPTMEFAWNAVYLYLGIGLLRGQNLKAPVLLLTLLNPWLLISLGTGLASNAYDILLGIRLSYPFIWCIIDILENGGLVLFVVGLYAIWAYYQDRLPQSASAGHESTQGAAN